MKFFVTYQMPHAGLDEWMKLPEEERKSQEAQMSADWDAWAASHKDFLLETAGVGKPKRVSADGVADARNDLMMYSFVEAQSQEAAAEVFKGHPHFGIPGGTIEIMPVNANVS